MDPARVAGTFDPSRLRLARQARGLKKKDLAELLGVSPAAISLYEKGSAKPTSAGLGRLALKLGLPVDFFRGDRPLEQVATTTAHFRSLRSTTQQERDHAFAHAVFTWELTEGLQRWVQIPAFDLPSDLMAHVDDPPSVAEAAALRARQYFGIPSGPIPNVVRLLESRGVACTRIPRLSEGVYAFSCPFPHRSVVVLSRAPLARGRYDAAHELGHLLLHHDEEPGSHAVERQANVFASEFLAPSREIGPQLPARIDWDRLAELKRVWGMSMQALLFKARELRVMGEHTYRRAMTQVSARGWRFREPGDDMPAERSILLAKALAVAARRGVDRSEVARHVRLDEATIAKIVGNDDGT